MEYQVVVIPEDRNLVRMFLDKNIKPINVPTHEQTFWFDESMQIIGHHEITDGVWKCETTNHNLIEELIQKVSPSAFRQSLTVVIDYDDLVTRRWTNEFKNIGLHEHPDNEGCWLSSGGIMTAALTQVMDTEHQYVMLMAFNTDVAQQLLDKVTQVHTSQSI